MKIVSTDGPNQRAFFRECRETMLQSPGVNQLSEGEGWPSHFDCLRFERQLLVRRASRVVVQAFNVAVIAAQGNIVETRDRQALTRVGRGDETPFWFIVSLRKIGEIKITHPSIA